jgi:hypothetical protein
MTSAAYKLPVQPSDSLRADTGSDRLWAALAVGDSDAYHLD